MNDIILSVLSLFYIAAGLVFFLIGSLIDKGHRNNAMNRERAERLIKLAICTTVLSWVFSAALAICVLVYGP